MTLIIFMVLWAIIGFFAFCYVYRLEDLDFNEARLTTTVLAFICGPILWATVLFGVIIGILRVIVIAMDGK